MFAVCFTILASIPPRFNAIFTKPFLENLALAVKSHTPGKEP